MFAPVTCFVTFVLFGRRLSGNNLYRRVLTKRKKSSRPSGSVPTAPPTLPTRGNFFRSFASWDFFFFFFPPLGGQEGAQGAPGVCLGGLPPLPSRSRLSERGGSVSWLYVWGARARFSFSFGSGRSGSCPLAVDSLFPRLRLRCLSPILTARSTT